MITQLQKMFGYFKSKKQYIFIIAIVGLMLTDYSIDTGKILNDESKDTKKQYYFLEADKDYEILVTPPFLSTEKFDITIKNPPKGLKIEERDSNYYLSWKGSKDGDYVFEIIFNNSMYKEAKTYNIVVQEELTIITQRK